MIQAPVRKAPATKGPAAKGPAPKTPATKGAPSGTSLARFIPDRELAAYVEFQGTDAHAAAWRKTAAYKLLNTTKLGALLTDLAAQGIDAATGAAKRGGGGPGGADVIAKAELFLQRGFAAGLSREGPGQDHMVAVFHSAAGPDMRGLLDALAASLSSPKGVKGDLKKGTRTLTTYGEGDNGFAIWAEKEDVIVCDLLSVDTVLETIGGRKPSMDAHKLRAWLGSQSAAYETLALGYVDVAKIGTLPPEAVKMGLDGVKRVEFRIGFNGDALMSMVRLAAPAPRKGVLALFDQPGFDMTSLPPIPAKQSGFTALSVDLAQTYDRASALF
jgi:hypothetical protein